VAVSGGADSLCLAYLLSRWGSPLGFIVDHGLRHDSAAEAAEAARRLAGFGVPSRVLAIAGLARGTGLAARARAARYAVLKAAAREAGCTDLLLGHHRLDQAETVLIRREAGSGRAGLAGMAAVSEGHDIRLVRPLLGVPPGRLRATLRVVGLDWVDDPSNRNPLALRNRLRIGLNDPEGRGAASVALADAAAGHGMERAALDDETAACLASRVIIRPEGFAVLSPGKLPVPALAALIRTIGGHDYSAALASLTRLADNPSAAVLGGVRLLAAGRHGPGWLVVREPAAMAPPVIAVPGAIWDRRFRLDAPAGLPEGLSFGAVGADAAALRKRSNLPAAVLRTLPALRVQGALAAVPHIGYLHSDMLECVVAAFFVPSHPLAGGRFAIMGRGCEAAGSAPC
jgi:tRNA(Ile)-lysidine synthase